MEQKDLSRKIAAASKWSFLTQIATKLVVPLTSMLLARILSPDEFGIVTTITMVISFADLFTDAGFQKYLIQHEFTDDTAFEKAVNVAFWTNLVISLTLWAAIGLLNAPLAAMVGNPGLGYVLVIAGVQLPLTSFTSIQTALYQRKFDFKTVFSVQMVASVIPLAVSVPLALLGCGFWSILIGNICGALEKAVVLTVKSPWKPKWYYRFSILKDMFSFSVFTLSSEIVIWLTSWVDSFLVGSKLDNHHLGLYKNSQSMVNQLISLFQYSVNPVLMTTLSRLQNDQREFNRFFLTCQRLMAFILFPLAVGVFLYRELATYVILGGKWMEASNIVGVWALTSALRVVLVSMVSIVFTAKGKPKYLMTVQLLDLCIVVPVCLLGLRSGFWTLVYARAAVRLDLVIPSLLLLHFCFGIRLKEELKNLCKPVLATAVMVGVVLLLQMVSGNMIWQFASIVIAAAVYLGMVILIAKPDVKMLISLAAKRKKT